MKFKYCLNKSVKTTVQPENKYELKDIIEETIKNKAIIVTLILLTLQRLLI